MKRQQWIVFVTALLLLVPLISRSPAEESLPYAPGQVLVKFKSNITSKKRKAILKRLRGQEVKSLAGIGVSVIALPNNTSPLSAVESFAKESQVEFAEPNYIYYAFDHGDNDYLPNDFLFSNQWGPKKIQAPGAWRLLANKSGSTPCPPTETVNVAICDTGIDLDHEDLKDKITKVMNFTGSPTPDDLFGHGTHVAGIAAAATDNAAGVGTGGVAGVGFCAKLFNVKVLDDNGSGFLSGIADGIRWAADNGADVINLSLGASFGATTLKSAVDYAWGKGTIVVAAAGNSGNTVRNYPAAYPNAIAVAATNSNNQRASFSTFGDWVDIAAPGVDILSTFPNHQNAIGPMNYGSLDGTSMASPHVAGVAALVIAMFPGKDAAFIRNQLQSTADALPGLGITGGLVNAHSAMKESTAPPPPPPPPPDGLNVTVATDRPSYTFGQLILITVTVRNGTTLLNGATVIVEILTPNGGRVSQRATQDPFRRGRYLLIGFASSSDGAGTYTATATASKTGFNPGTGSTTFTVR
jgi:thermitase